MKAYSHGQRAESEWLCRKTIAITIIIKTVGSRFGSANGKGSKGDGDKRKEQSDSGFRAIIMRR